MNEPLNEFFNLLKRTLKEYDLDCFYSEDLWYLDLMSFFCTNQLVIRYSLLSKQAGLNKDDPDEHFMKMKGSVGYFVQIDGLTILITNQHLTPKSSRRRKI